MKMKCKVRCSGETIIVDTSDLVKAIKFAIGYFDLSNASSMSIVRFNDKGAINE